MVYGLKGGEGGGGGRGRGGNILINFDILVSEVTVYELYFIGEKNMVKDKAAKLSPWKI